MSKTSPSLLDRARHVGRRAALLAVAAMLAAGCTPRGIDDAPAPAEGFVTVEGGWRLHYRTYGGGGETLVLLHGGPGANSMGVGPDLVSLAERHTLVLYDQRGSGRSDPVADATGLTADTHVRDLETLRRELGFERMTLIGHSWGCVLAALYATEHPDRVERLLLLGPMEPTRELLDRRFEVAARISEQAAAELAALDEREDLADDPAARCRAFFDIMQAYYYYDPAKMAVRRGDYCDAPGDVLATMEAISGAVVGALGAYDLRPQLAQLRMPALVVEGAQSPLPLAGEEVWAESLGNARLWLIDEVGHAYPMVEAPGVFFPGVERFLAGGWPAGATRP